MAKSGLSGYSKDHWVSEDNAIFKVPVEVMRHNRLPPRAFGRYWWSLVLS
jgi:hypothetical protein